MFERSIKFRPAYDKRKEGCGIHPMEVCFYLKGPKGVIQFVIASGWHLKHVRPDLREHHNRWEGYMAIDMGYHSPVPLYEGQSTATESCALLDGKPCYRDGSFLSAEKVFDRFLAEGEDVVWQEMEKYYQRLFEEEENANAELS